MWSSLNGMVVGGGCGGQVGLVYDLGLLSYTSEKSDSADCWSKQGMVDESSSLKSLDANLQNDCWHTFLALEVSKFILAFGDVFFALLCNLKSLWNFTESS